MHRRTARGNRLGLAVVGALLLAAGVAIALAHLGVIPGADATAYPSTVQRFVADQQSWLYWALGVVAVVIGLVFLRWLLVQPRADRLSRVVLDTDAADDDGAGRTVLPAGAAAAAVEDDVVALRGVRTARVDLGGSPDAPELWMTVRADSDADLGRIRAEIASAVVPDARAALEVPDLPAYVTLVVDRRPARDRGLV